MECLRLTTQCPDALQLSVGHLHRGPIGDSWCIPCFAVYKMPPLFLGVSLRNLEPPTKKPQRMKVSDYDPLSRESAHHRNFRPLHIEGSDELVSIHPVVAQWRGPN